MKKILLIILVVLAVGAGVVAFRPLPENGNPSPEDIAGGGNQDDFEKGVPAVAVMARNLEIPWDIAFLPEGGMLVSERPGRLLHIAEDGTKTVVHDEDVRSRGEGGLLGIVLHPEFEENRYIYLYFTAPGGERNTENRVERHHFDGERLSDRTVIIEGIPGALYHDGGRMEFGPDGMLYITTGDATEPESAQNLGSLGGKILRLRGDGSVPEGNPFGTAVYSYGHRNPQGITWDMDGRLWSTEHGRSGILSGLDELNLVVSGSNYGWPESEGDKVQSGTAAPALHSGPDVTWAPASAAYLQGSVFFGGLRGETLYEAVLEGERVAEFKTHFHQEFGRIRTVRVGPDGMLYLMTSNRDGRGTVQEGDDKIIRVNPAKL